MILSAQSIVERCLADRPLIPFVDCKRIAHGHSWGLGAASYDVRLADGMWLFPFWGRLGRIIEYIRMPLDLAGQVKDKSTNARLFILVQNTWIDPGWEG